MYEDMTSMAVGESGGVYVKKGTELETGKQCEREGKL